MSIALPAFAHTKWPDYSQIKWERLNLTSGQQSYLNNLDQQWKVLIAQYVPRIEQKQHHFKELILAPEPDEKRIMDLARDIYKDKSKLQMEATRIFLQKRKILSPEQLHQLRVLMEVH